MLALYRASKGLRTNYLAFPTMLTIPRFSFCNKSEKSKFDISSFARNTFSTTINYCGEKKVQLENFTKEIANESMILKLKDKLMNPSFLDEYKKYALEKAGLKNENLTDEELKQVFRNVKAILTASNTDLIYATTITGVDVALEGLSNDSDNSFAKMCEIIDKVALHLEDSGKIQKTMEAALKLKESEPVNNLKIASEKTFDETRNAALGTKKLLESSLPNVSEKFNGLKSKFPWTGTE